jgi:hypothetical protein
MKTEIVSDYENNYIAGMANPQKENGYTAIAN